MRLTKVELTEGIKLSNLKGMDPIYYKDHHRRLTFKSERQNIDSLDFTLEDYCTIIDNKVIDIIQHEEYDNSKPYLIGKDENHIVGFLELSSRTYWYAYIAGIKATIKGESLADLIVNVNNSCYNVYKQE